MKSILAITFINSSAFLWSLTSFAARSPVSPKAPFKKVLVIVFENANYSVALKQPYFAKFAKKGALLTDFMAESHPSQGNYIALVGGDEFGVKDDTNVVINAHHVGNLLSKKGLSWKVYAEGFPGHCYLGARHDRYARKHVPLLSFKNVEKNQAQCAHIVGSAQWQKDLAANSLPNFSLYIPNLDDDGHDTGPAFASKWFSKFMSNLEKRPKVTKHLLIIATFDESAGSSANHIYTALYGAGIRPGSKSNHLYNHYSLLRTLEKYWHLGSLDRNDKKAKAIQGVWQKSVSYVR